MIKHASVFLAILILASCTVYAPVHDYVEVVEQSKLNSFYRHAEYGRMSVDAEPLQTHYNTCTKQSFEGKRLLLGDVELDFPNQVETVYRDYHAYLMESVLMWGAKDEKLFKKLIDEVYADDEYKSIRRAAFESSVEISEQLKAITRVVRQREKCLENLGWRYYKRR